MTMPGPPVARIVATPGVLHQRAGGLDGRVLDPLDTVLGSTGLDGGVAHNLGGLDGALLRAGVEAEDDRAACLQGDEGLEDGGGGRVGNRGDTGDHATGSATSSMPITSSSRMMPTVFWPAK